MAQYFVNPRTGRKCKVGGPTHKRLLKQGGKGIPAMLAGLLLKEVGIPLVKKLFKKKQKGKGHYGKGHYPRGKSYPRAKGSKNRMMMSGTGLTVAGGALKLAGQGKKKRYHPRGPRKYVFE